jgi:CubicO group peptidase (beta-lactamase class C family)
MKTLLAIHTVFILSLSASGQTYFPPKFSPVWDTVNPASLGWCTDKIDTLADFLQTHNTKGFIILKDGKIAWEKYFGTFTQDSLWYWASAGKSLFGFLAGQAQEQGFFSLDDTVSSYLGNGWTSLPAADEQKINISHLLSMHSGLKDNVPDPNCQLPACLQYQAAAGTRWAYHNAPYTLSHQVLENATGLTLQQFTTQNLLLKTGMIGAWFTDAQTNEIFGSRTRDMARFGLLMQNNGIWAGDTLLADTAYFNQMINSSQQQNLSYGYLWWLNGKQSYMVPQSQLVLPGLLIPNAPADAWCALGKNDQKLYVSQSTGLVVVRLGNDAGNPGLAPTIFDNLLWAEINKVLCGTIAISENTETSVAEIWAVDGTQTVILKNPITAHCEIFSGLGQQALSRPFSAGRHEITLPTGLYIAILRDANGQSVQKVLVR